MLVLRQGGRCVWTMMGWSWTTCNAQTTEHNIQHTTTPHNPNSNIHTEEQEKKEKEKETKQEINQQQNIKNCKQATTNPTKTTHQMMYNHKQKIKFKGKSQKKAPIDVEHADGSCYACLCMCACVCACMCAKVHVCVSVSECMRMYLIEWFVTVE